MTDRKLNGDNSVLWKQVVEIHVTWRVKNHDLIDDPPIQRRRLGGKTMQYFSDRLE